MAKQKFRIGEAAIDHCTFEKAVDRVAALAQTKVPSMVVTPNTDHVLRLQNDPTFGAAYRFASLTLADGMPIVMASRLLGEPLPERVTGADLVPALCARAAAAGLKVFFFGAPPGVAALAAAVAHRTYPGLALPGAYCPPLGFERDPIQNELCIASIRSASPDIVFVALGSPKQEYWIAEHFQEFTHGVFLGVGAAVEFLAGTQRRSPVWMQKVGLEWLHRLLSEPRRLWRRYLSNVLFVKIFFNEWQRRKKARLNGGTAGP